MRYEEIMPDVRAGRRARSAAWPAENGRWLELVPAHPLPDGRMVAEMLMVGYGDGQPLRQFGGTSYDLAEADDWELLTDSPGRP